MTTRIIHIPAFSTDGLPAEQEELSARFVGWTITFRVVVDGFTWAMPVGVLWTASRDGSEVPATSADDLAEALRRSDVR